MSRSTKAISAGDPFGCGYPRRSKPGAHRLRGLNWGDFGRHSCDQHRSAPRPPHFSGTKESHRDIRITLIRLGKSIGKLVNAARLIRPISARSYLGVSLRSSAAILVRRLTRRSSTGRESPLVSDSVRRNISMTC